MEEVAAYPAGGGHADGSPDREGEMLGPVRLRAASGGEWSFFGMFASFDTPGAGRDVVVYLALVGGVAIACGAGDFRREVVVLGAAWA